RVAKVNGEYIVNPTVSEIKQAELDFIIGATERNIMMVEGEAQECQEEDLIRAIEIAHDAIRTQVKAQLELRSLVGVGEKREVEPFIENDEIKNRVEQLAAQKINEIISSGSAKH